MRTESFDDLSFKNVVGHLGGSHWWIPGQERRKRDSNLFSLGIAIELLGRVSGQGGTNAKENLSLIRSFVRRAECAAPSHLNRDLVVLRTEKTHE